MQNTANYNLKKPESNEFVNVDDINSNMDIIDEQLKNIDDYKVTKIIGKGLSTNDYTTVEKEKLATLNNYDDSGLKQEISTKADLTYVDNKLTEQKTYIDTSKNYTLSHNRAEATIINGVTSDVGVGEKSPDNPYTLSGVETNGVALYSLPNGICDEYNSQTGVLTKRVSKVVLNGNKGSIVLDRGFKNTLDLAKVITTPPDAKKDIKGNIVSNKFIADEVKISKEPYYIFNHWSSSIYISLNLSDIGVTQSELDNKDLTKIEQWFSQNPVTVLYELATPETIQLTPKTTYQHTLSDLPTGQGIYQCQFIATADYNEGDVFTGYTAKPQGEETILPDKSFVKGDIVSITVDTVNKKLGFKIGGSGVNQTLPPQIRSFAVTSGNAQNKLSWLLPVDTSAYEGLVIVKKVGSAPTKVSDGTKISLSKTATSYTDTGLTNDIKYYYRAFPYNSKKQYQTELTGAVVSGTPKAFSLPTYTGQHTIFGDINEGRIEMYTSGTLTLSPATYDIFAVGGGGGGNGATYESKENGGGGGGYTNTIKAYTVTSNRELSVLVGSGGIGGSSGNSTKPTNGNNSGVFSLVAIGGKAPVGNGKGGDGGSGGGGSRDISIGGSDGNDGQGNYFGIGQHSTTKSFGESTGILYAGGGGHTGGAGGGGNGSYPHGQNGNTNTGGGGGGGYGDSVHIGIGGNGGSGIAIVRWKRN